MVLLAASSLTTLLLALAIAIAAKPVHDQKSFVKMPVKRRSLANLNSSPVEHDQHRAKSLGGRAARGSIPSTTLNYQKLIFTVNIGVGDPVRSFDLLLDCGSSVTWVGANFTSNQHVNTTTTQLTGNSVNVSYGGDLSFSGDAVIDKVTIGLDSNLVIDKQWIGAASMSTGFHPFQVDGIMGIGPTNLTIGLLDPDVGISFETITDSLFSSGAIPDHLVSINLHPINMNQEIFNNLSVGELDWGGIDTSQIIGNITYAPVTTTSPASSYWGFDASLTYGSTKLLSTTAGIVDTGTTFLLLANNAYTAYQSATGAVLDPNTNLLTITSSQFKELQGLTFTISGVPFTLTPDAQIVPQNMNVALGGVAANIYLIVQKNGHNSGSGVDFTFGMLAIQRFYCVLDTGNQRIGFAQKPDTNANVTVNLI